jgi:hypothetical protein
VLSGGVLTDGERLIIVDDERAEGVWDFDGRKE